jgi:very-short-patch-repair endonuclease
MKQTEAQILLQVHLKELGMATIPEYRFDPERNWHADLACLEHRILFECDGGQFKGGHKRGIALEQDYEKQNEAQAQGWRIFRFTNRQILTGAAYDYMKKFRVPFLWGEK